MSQDPKTFQDHQDSTNENKKDEPISKKSVADKKAK